MYCVGTNLWPSPRIGWSTCIYVQIWLALKVKPPVPRLSLVVERSYEAHGGCGNGLNGGLSRHYDELDATSVVDAGLESA